LRLVFGFEEAMQRKLPLANRFCYALSPLTYTYFVL
jgi:hypothetical protein